MPRVKAETLTLNDLSTIATREFSDWKYLGVPVGKSRSLPTMKDIPKTSGTYIWGIAVGNAIVPVYAGSACSEGRGFYHRLYCELNIRQNEESVKGKLQGPSHIWAEMKRLGKEVCFYISLYESTNHGTHIEHKLLTNADFIGNAQKNGDRRLKDLTKLFVNNGVKEEAFEEISDEDQKANAYAQQQEATAKAAALVAQESERKVVEAREMLEDAEKKAIEDTYRAQCAMEDAIYARSLADAAKAAHVYKVALSNRVENTKKS